MPHLIIISGNVNGATVEVGFFFSQKPLDGFCGPEVPHQTKLSFQTFFLNYTFIIFLIEPPVFVKPFESAEFVKGSDIVLTGTISGSPPFEISCFLNDKLIRSNKKHQIHVQKDTVTLQISDCDSKDDGTYQCTVANDVGETACSCQVSLKG